MVGLYKSQRPPQLLSIIGGRPTKAEGSQCEKKKPSAKKFKVPGIMDLPLSTDEEDDEDDEDDGGGEDGEVPSSRKQLTVAKDNSLDSSEDEGFSRGAMKRTVFKSCRTQPAGRKAEDIADGGESVSALRNKRKAHGLGGLESDAARRKGSGNSASTHLHEGIQRHQSDDFLTSSQASRRRRQQTYAKKAKVSDSQESGQTKLRRESISSNSDASHPTKNAGKKTLRDVPELPNTPENVTRRGIRPVESDLLTSPVKARETKGLKVHADMDDSDLPANAPESTRMKSESLQKPPLGKNQLGKSGLKGARQEKGESPNPVTFKPKFRMPSAIPDRDLDAADAEEAAQPGTWSAVETSDDENSLPVLASKAPEPVVTLCPWCREPVPSALLAEYTSSKGGKRLTVKQQTIFCRKHKTATAMESWKERGYPAIVWDNLTARLDAHSPHILEIINGGPSHFGDKLARSIQEGKSRALRQEDNLCPGYYGPRGLNVMSDYAVNKYGGLLKEKAIENRVISGRGSAAFIQSVLVAELAVRLIMEDMGIDEEEARVVIEQSKELGEMIHEEES